MRDRLAVICGAVPRDRGLVSGFYRDDGRELRSKHLISGVTVPASGSVFGSWQVRVSWRTPDVAWFVNGKRVGAGRLSGADAGKVAAAPVALYCGMFNSRQKDDAVTVKMTEIAVGLPHKEDFAGTAGPPAPPEPPPEPEFRPRPRPRPRPWRPPGGGEEPPQAPPDVK